MSRLDEAIFLSYASQDVEAAKRICDSLRTAGLDVWFDQSDLHGGDAWDAAIRKQVKDYALFMPSRLIPMRAAKATSAASGIWR